MRAQLLAEADEMVEAACGPLNFQNAAPASHARSSAATATIATTDTLPLCNFYSRELRPFLQQARAQNPALSNRLKAAGIFEGLRTLLPAALHGTVKIWKTYAKRNGNCGGRYTITTGCMDG